MTGQYHPDLTYTWSGGWEDDIAVGRGVSAPLLKREAAPGHDDGSSRSKAVGKRGFDMVNGHAVDREGPKIKAEIETLRQQTGTGATINDLSR